MINVLVSGCNGKMGKEVINEIDYFENMLFLGGFDPHDKRTKRFYCLHCYSGHSF